MSVAIPDKKTPKQFEDKEQEKAQIETYFKSDKYLEGLPEDYKETYREILQKWDRELPPIEEECQVTVILPAYKEERLILEALESLSQQQDIDPKSFEVILVVNYPTDKKPNINDYDEDGHLSGQHPDRTYEIANEFSTRHPDFRLRVIEQNFPAEVEGEKIAE